MNSRFIKLMLIAVTIMGQQNTAMIVPVVNGIACYVVTGDVPEKSLQANKNTQNFITIELAVFPSEEPIGNPERTTTPFEAGAMGSQSYGITEEQNINLQEALQKFLEEPELDGSKILINKQNLVDIAAKLCNTIRHQKIEALAHFIDNNDREWVTAVINADDEDGATSLHCAAFIGNKEIIKLLLKAGADNRLGDEDGSCAIGYYYNYRGFHDKEVERWLTASAEELEKLL